MTTPTLSSLRRWSAAMHPLLPAVLLALLCLAAGVLTSSAAATTGAATTSPPISPSDYEVGPICPPPAPGFSGCLGLRLEADQPQTAEVTEPIRGSLSPANLLSAYNLTGATPPITQTIALVDAYDDATVFHDLEVFDAQFGLPACNEANGCLRKLNQSGNAGPLPASAEAKERGWAQEIATDVEVAHGVCQSCKLVLVEASSNSNKDLYASEQTAAGIDGVTEISDSWGGAEPSTDNADFNHPGIVITASAGDDGYLNWFTGEPAGAANYPASSPHVVAVGGTRLLLNSAKAWESETVWNDGGVNGNEELEGAGATGGGCSGRFAAPTWQSSLPNWASVGCGGERSVSDISADGDPYSGVAVYDSTEPPHGERGWAAIGGTSVASPIIAAAFALAGGSQGVAYPAQLLYENARQDPASLHDVSVGSNGECRKKFHKNTGVSGCGSSAEEAAQCGAQARCLAGPGYDGPSGVGTPDGLAAFRPPAGGGTPTNQAAVVPAATTPSRPAPSGTSSPGTGTTTTVPGGASPIVSALSLTRTALAALNHKRPKVSRVGFGFTLSSPARVHVTIAKRVRVRGRQQWRTISAPLTVNARRGAQQRRLSGHATLAGGRYRLTVTPAGGRARSIVFSVA